MFCALSQHQSKTFCSNSKKIENLCSFSPIFPPQNVLLVTEKALSKHQRNVFRSKSKKPPKNDSFFLPAKRSAHVEFKFDNTSQKVSDQNPKNIHNIMIHLSISSPQNTSRKLFDQSLKNYKIKKNFFSIMFLWTLCILTTWAKKFSFKVRKNIFSRLYIFLKKTTSRKCSEHVE